MSIIVSRLHAEYRLLISLPAIARSIAVDVKTRARTAARAVRLKLERDATERRQHDASEVSQQRIMRDADDCVASLSTPVYYTALHRTSTVAACCIVINDTLIRIRSHAAPSSLVSSPSLVSYIHRVVYRAS